MITAQSSVKLYEYFTHYGEQATGGYDLEKLNEAFLQGTVL